jgi:hypothetical protein
MRSIGYVLLNWTSLESAFIDDIRRMRASDGDRAELSTRARGGFSERLAEWRALMSQKTRRNAEVAQEVGELATLAEGLRRNRLLIGQHFVGAISGDAEGGPAILVAEGGVSSARITQQKFAQSDLDKLIEELNDCRLRLLRLAERV